MDNAQFKQLFFSVLLCHPTCTDEQLDAKLKKFKLEKEPETNRYSMALVPISISVETYQ